MMMIGDKWTWIRKDKIGNLDVQRMMISDEHDFDAHA